PLKQLLTVNYMRFVTSRFISKVVASHTWPEPSEFKWTLLTPANVESYYAQFQTAYAIAGDIETTKVNLAIRCIGYTGVFLRVGGTVDTVSVVLPVDSEWALAWMRKFNDLPAQKIFQNGKYDATYLLRYNAPL